MLYTDPVCATDREDFFKFAEKLFDNTNTISVDQSQHIPMVAELFKLFSNPKLFDINSITSTSLEVFCTTFLHINIHNGKILKHDNPLSPSCPLFNASPPSSPDNNDIANALKHCTLRVRPDELEGFDILWSIIFTSDQEAIAADALKLLQDLFNRNNQANLLLAKCTEAIKHSTCDKALNKYFNIMNKLFLESESKGVPTIRAHRDLLKEDVITFKLIYMNATPNEQVSVYKNTTLSELKIAIAKQSACAYDDIVLEYNREVIPCNQHCVPLSKVLSLGNDDEIIVKVSEHTYVDLLDPFTGKANPRFEAVINEWFDVFSEEKERMTQEKIRDFTEKVTQHTKPILIDDERVRGLLDRYDHDNKGYITRENFLHFYVTAAKDKRALVWNNLLSMGYRENLTKKSEEAEIDVTPKEMYPRYLLGNDKQFLNIVFGLFDNSSADSEGVNMDLLNFVSNLCTNEDMYKHMLTEMNAESVLVNNDNQLIDLYKMHIIESFVENVKGETQVRFTNYETLTSDSGNVKELKQKWIQSFYESGQYAKLILYVCGLLQKLSHVQTKAATAVMCLNKSVKLLFTFFALTLNGNDAQLPQHGEHTNVTDQRLLQLINELISFITTALADKTSEHVDMRTCFMLCVSLLVNKPDLFARIANSNDSGDTPCRLLRELLTTCLMSKQPEHCAFFINTLIEYTSVAHDIGHHNILFYLYSTCLQLFERILRSNDNTTSFTLFFDYFTALYEIICVLRARLPSPALESHITRYNVGSDEFILNLYHSVIDYVLSHHKTTQTISGDLFVGAVKLLIKGIQNSPSTKTALLSERRNSVNVFNELIKFVIPSEDDSTGSNDSTVHYQTNQFIPLDTINSAKEDELALLSQKKCVCELISALIEGNADYSAEYFISNAESLSELLQTVGEEPVAGVSQEATSSYYRELMYQPERPRGRSEGYVGLKNLGCICYMNSIMQQIYMVPTFRYAILQSDDRKDIDPSQFDDNLLHQLQRMYTYLLLSQKEYYNPKLFCLAYRDMDGNPTNVVVQQDSQEFLNSFCDKIETHLKETEFKYIVNDVFCGRTCSQVVCDSCGHVSNRFEAFYDLTLEVKNISSLSESLEKMVSPEKIDDFNCENCRNKVTITKRTTLATLPNVLIVHLRRFWMNYDDLHTEKINSTFKFPFEINLKKFCIEDIMAQAQHAAYDTDEIYYKDDEYYEYTLKGVTVHMGTADGGHYFSFINVDRDNASSPPSSADATWLKFNDSHVSKFDVKELPEECFGGARELNGHGHGHGHVMHEFENCQNAYLLIYERHAKTPIRYVYKTQTQFNTADVIAFDEAQRNATLKRHDVSRKQPQQCRNELTHALACKVFHDVQKNEHFVYREFYSLDKKVPLVYYRQVQTTNKQFLRKQNKDKSFHELLKQIELDFKTHVQQHPEIISRLDNRVKASLCDIVLNKLFTLLSCNDSNNNDESISIVLADLNIYFTILTQLIEDNEVNTAKFFAFLETNSRFSLLATLDKTYLPFIEQLCLFMENILDKSTTITDSCCQHAQEVIKLTLSLFTMNTLNLHAKASSPSSPQLLLPPFYSLFHKVLKRVDSSKHEEMQTHFNIISFLAKSLVSTYDEFESQSTTTTHNEQLCIKYKQCCDTIIECLFSFLMRLSAYNDIQYIPAQCKLHIDTSDDRTARYIRVHDINSVLTKLESDAFLNALLQLNVQCYANVVYLLYCSHRNVVQDETVRILKEMERTGLKRAGERVMKLYDILVTLLSIKDSKTPEKFICILGYPELNVEYVNRSDCVWPVFGYELYKRDDKSMYRYVTPNHVDKDYSLLQMFNNEFNYAMCMRLLTATKEHFGLFKYLYLMPSNAMRFNNYYEEMLLTCEAYARNERNDAIKAKMFDEIADIKTCNKSYEERVIKYVKAFVRKDKEQSGLEDEHEHEHEESYELPGWKGYLTELVPREIVNENIRKLAEGQDLLFYLFEYETTFIHVDLLQPSIRLLQELESEMNGNTQPTASHEDTQVTPTEEGVFITKLQKTYQRQNPLVLELPYRGYKEKRFIKQFTSSCKYNNNLLLTFTNPKFKHDAISADALIKVSRFTIINNTCKKGTITFINKVHCSSSTDNYFIPNTVVDALLPNDYRDCFIIHSFRSSAKHFVHSDTSWSIKLNIEQPSF